ncbi:MAG: polysaccharide biosynthesis tyrosine autokinase, partial [Bacteroidetes bacterium]|nr:polysaccharide biosynthesis tyrosine autokinase [Bacteroidota bacterium]
FNQLSENSESNQFELMPFLYSLLKKWYFIILGIVVGYFISYTFLRYSTPQFQAISKVELNKLDEEDPMNGIVGKRNIGFRQAKDIENDLTKLKSFEVSEAAISQMNVEISYFDVGRVKGLTEIYKNHSPERFVCIYASNSMRDRFLRFSKDNDEYFIEILDNDLKIDHFRIHDLGLDEFKTNEGKVKMQLAQNHLLLPDSILCVKPITDNVNSGIYIKINSKTNLIKRFMDGLSVKKEGDELSTIVQISSKSNIPQYAVSYVKAVAESYVKLDLDERIETLKKANKFVTDKINDLWDSLIMLDDSINLIKKTNGISSIGLQTQEIFEEFKELSLSKSAIQSKLDYIDTVSKYIVDINEFEKFQPPVIVGVEDVAFASQINDIHTEFSLLSNEMRGLKKSNPFYERSVQTIRRRINVLRETLMKIRNQKEFEKKAIETRINEVSLNLSKFPDLETSLLNLKRNYGINETIYKNLLQKRVEIGIELASAVSNHQVLSVSNSATKIYPESRRIMILGLGAGAAIPILIMLLLFYFDRRIKSIGHITAFTNIPFVGALPKVDEFGPAFIFNYPKSMLAESLRAVKNNIGYLIDVDHVPVLVVTSSKSGDGKTFTAENLGAIYSYAGKKTVVIGGDLRRPKLFAEFNIKRQAGLSEYLSYQVNEDEIITETGFKNLWVIGAGANPPNPAELLEREHLKKLLNYLKSRFDLIIIDTPPYQIVTDTGILASHADAMIYVMRHNSTGREVIDRVNQFPKDNLPPIGIVLNVFDENKAYGYRYTSYSKNMNYNYSGYYGRIQGDGYYVDSGSGKKSNWWQFWK